jgi:hypothetical protein
VPAFSRINPPIETYFEVKLDADGGEVLAGAVGYYNDADPLNIFRGRLIVVTGDQLCFCQCIERKVPCVWVSSAGGAEYWQPAWLPVGTNGDLVTSPESYYAHIGPAPQQNLVQQALINLADAPRPVPIPLSIPIPIQFPAPTNNRLTFITRLRRYTSNAVNFIKEQFQCFNIPSFRTSIRTILNLGLAGGGKKQNRMIGGVLDNNKEIFTVANDIVNNYLVKLNSAPNLNIYSQITNLYTLLNAVNIWNRKGCESMNGEIIIFAARNINYRKSNGYNY